MRAASRADEEADRGRVSRATSAHSATLAGLVLWALVASAPAQQLELEPVLGGLQSPLYLTHAGDDRVFVVERGGTIRVASPAPPGGGLVLATEPFLDLSDRVLAGGERGLLGLAFHPDYQQNGRLFVYYTDLQGDSVLARFENVDPSSGVVPPSSFVEMLLVEQPFSNHNGGMLAFGPDGMLYVGLGDGGSGDDPLCAAQRGDTLLGKILRLDVDGGAESPPFYTVPPDNPFVGDPTVRDEVFLLGVRNPWRFSFDRLSGDLFVGDVGQDSREEISLVPLGTSGVNLGWKMLEGTLCRNQSGGCGGPLPPCGSSIYTPPILEYGHGEGFSVTGGYVYRGDALPGLAGRYLFGDFGSGRVWVAERSGGGWTRSERPQLRTPGLASFGEDAAGGLYLVSLGGEVFALRSGATPPPPPAVIGFTAERAEVGEEVPFLMLDLERSGDLGERIEARVRSVPTAGTATPGEDYEELEALAIWLPGAGGVRRVALSVIDDVRIENDEELEVRIESATGARVDPQRDRVTVRLLAEAVPGEGTPSLHVLCLLDSRFAVTARWRDFTDLDGPARTTPLTDDSGAFWFLDFRNIELVVKVLDGCAINGHFWVFMTGLTNLEVEGEVVDIAAAAGSPPVYSFSNPLGTGFQPILDTEAFAGCP